MVTHDINGIGSLPMTRTHSESLWDTNVTAPYRRVAANCWIRATAGLGRAQGSEYLLELFAVVVESVFFSFKSPNYVIKQKYELLQGSAQIS